MTLDECRAAIGQPVVYTPYGQERQETGVITATGHLYAFVRYGSDGHSKATAPERLTLVEAQ